MTAAPQLTDTLDTFDTLDAPAPAAGAGAPARLAARLLTTGPAVPGALRRHADAVLAVLLALATGVVHAVGVFGFPSLADDEGTYVAQSAAVRGGELTHYTYWYDHPPLGW